MNEPIRNQNQMNPESYSPKIPKLANMMEQIKMENFYPAEFVLPDNSTKTPPEIKHYGPAYVRFANEFSHFLDYTGQGYGFIFDGDWCKDRSYTIADILSGNAMQPADITPKENIEYLWKTAGFSLYHTFCADPAHIDYMSKEEMKKTIKYTLYKLGQPVIIPQDEYFTGSIIIGYKNNGDILLSYRYIPHFMNMENNANPVISEIPDWYKNNTSLFIAGKRENIFSLEDLYRKGIRRVYECLNANINAEKRRYYDEWEAFLRLNTEEMIAYVKRMRNVPGGENGQGIGGGQPDDAFDDKTWWNAIADKYNNTWCNMAERRHYVMNFFRQAKEYFPEVLNELQELDNHFCYTYDIMGNTKSGYNSEIGDPVNPEILKDHNVRNRMAECVHRFKEADAKGLELVENLIEKMGMKYEN